jgi:hypothetical protein
MGSLLASRGLANDQEAKVCLVTNLAGIKQVQSSGIEGERTEVETTTRNLGVVIFCPNLARRLLKKYRKSESTCGCILARRLLKKYRKSEST